MTTRIIVTGRGGTGKSSFAALAATELKGAPLIIDADPDQCLSTLLGVDLHEEGVKTVSEALYEIQTGAVEKSVESLPLSQKVDYLLQLSCLYESEDFDLLTLGVQWTRGCYCAPNNALRTLVTELSSNYDYAVFDSPAGLEHINRRIVSEVDDIFAIVDPSAKALRNARNLAEISEVIDLSYKNLNIIANHRFPAGMLEHLQGLDEGRYLGKLEEDRQVESFDWAGRPLPELPPDSPARVSVRQLLARAGLNIKA